MPALAFSAQPTVTADGGAIACDGKAITSGGRDSQPVLSPDGHTVAFVRTTGKAGDAYTADPSELWIGDCATGETHRLLAPAPSDTPKRNLTSVNNPTFSLDGGFVYVMAQAWADLGRHPPGQYQDRRGKIHHRQQRPARHPHRALSRLPAGPAAHVP
ncbi:MAG: hypothetical protein WDN06_06395 [Asticcacaulis sp.]